MELIRIYYLYEFSRGKYISTISINYLNMELST